ncbi:MAG TPA: RDD family protein [Gaiellaceae bacterium]
MAGEAAGFWRRFGAAFIDGILLNIVSWILLFVLGTGGYVLSAIISLGYYTFFHGRTGQTPGDAAVGIRVLDIEDRSVIGYGRALGRTIVSIASGVVILLGYLWMLWDPRKQTWHDKAVRSLPIMDR